MSVLTLSNFRSAEYQFCFLSPLSFGWEEYLEWARIVPWSSCLASNRSNHKTKAAVNDGQQLVERSSDSRVRILPPKLLFLLLLYFCSSRELTNVVFLRKAFGTYDFFRSVCSANKEIQWKRNISLDHCALWVFHGLVLFILFNVLPAWHTFWRIRITKLAWEILFTET